jgi:LPS sulfotransferase NodH
MQTPYSQCRFIVLGAPRSGSNFLMSLLSAHTNVKAYGEMFNLDMLSPAQLEEVLEDPVAYLQKRIYLQPPEGKSAVGFKIFYDHLTKDYFSKIVDRDYMGEKVKNRIDKLNDFIEARYSRSELYERFEKAWSFLIDDNKLKVIHLKRVDKLQSLLSLKMAYRTNEWMNYTGKSTDKPMLEVGYEECRSYFTRMEEYETKYSNLFAAHDKIDINYEDLATQKEVELDRVLDFLNLPKHPLFTRLHKQNESSPGNIIINYDALKDRFVSTRWNMFFS